MPKTERSPGARTPSQHGPSPSLTAFPDPAFLRRPRDAGAMLTPIPIPADLEGRSAGTGAGPVSIRTTMSSYRGWRPAPPVGKDTRFRRAMKEPARGPGAFPSPGPRAVRAKGAVGPGRALSHEQDAPRKLFRAGAQHHKVDNRFPGGPRGRPRRPRSGRGFRFQAILDQGPNQPSVDVIHAQLHRHPARQVEPQRRSVRPSPHRVRPARREREPQRDVISCAAAGSVISTVVNLIARPAPRVAAPEL